MDLDKTEEALIKIITETPTKNANEEKFQVTAILVVRVLASFFKDVKRIADALERHNELKDRFGK